MSARTILCSAAAMLLCAMSWSPLRSESGPASDSVVWKFDNLKQIGGEEVRVVGEPRVIESDGEKSIAFDGRDDGLFFDVHPLAGMKQFTAEVVFRPAAGGPAEQRFFHMQEDGSEDRVMFETRLTPEGKWFLDTHIQSAGAGYTQFAKEFLHPIGPWYHAALVIDGDQMRHYVNGKLEMTSKIDYQPQKRGKTSLGVRLNKVFWFEGAIRTARFTPRPLDPKDFLKP